MNKKNWTILNIILTILLITTWILYITGIICQWNIYTTIFQIGTITNLLIVSTSAGLYIRKYKTNNKEFI